MSRRRDSIRAACDMIAEMISSYRKTTGSTVIIVSHSMEDVAKSADKVLVMNKSEVEMFGTVNEVFSKVERLADIGLNVPQLTQIFLNLKHNGMAVRTDIYTIKKRRGRAVAPFARGGRFIVIKDITIGQFFPGNSVIHKLDPKNKTLF